MKTSLEQTVFSTKSFNLDDMRRDPEAMLCESLKEVSSFINSKIQECNESGYRMTDIGIKWINIPCLNDDSSITNRCVRVVLTREPSLP